MVGHSVAVLMMKHLLKFPSKAGVYGGLDGSYPTVSLKM